HQPGGPVGRGDRRSSGGGQNERRQHEGQGAVLNTHLSVEICDLAERILSLAERQRLSVEADDDCSAATDRRGAISDAVLAAAASRELARRASRARFLPSGFFSEGGWAILLDLFVSEHKVRIVSVKSACIASGLPATTALRTIEALLGSDLIARFETASDKRLKLLRLTEAGRESMRSVLREYV
ncbi:MAG: hypothetical protein WBA51_08585, partial [Erythrobacter sp.]